MTEKSIPALLFDLIEHARRAQRGYNNHASQSEFESDRLSMDAVLWNFIVMGEICNRLGGRFHADYPDIPWMGVIGLRNVIAHGYDIVDWNIIGPVIKNDLPLLIKHAQRILDSYGPPPEM